MCINVWHHQGTPGLASALPLRAVRLVLVFPWLTWLAFLVVAIRRGLSFRRPSCAISASCHFGILFDIHGQAMLTGPGSYSESKENTVNFPEISTPILEKVQTSLPSFSIFSLLWVKLCGFHDVCAGAWVPCAGNLAHQPARLLPS